MAKSEYRFCLLGDEGCGKTSLIRSFLSLDSRPSNADSIDKYSVEFNQKGVINNVEFLDIGGKIDLTGDPKIVQMIESSDCFLFCYSVTKQESLKNLDKWIKEVQKLNSNATTLVVGCKAELRDKVENTVPLKEGRVFAQKYGAGYSECSALLNRGVKITMDEALTLVNLISRESPLNAAAEEDDDFDFLEGRGNYQPKNKSNEKINFGVQLKSFQSTKYPFSSKDDEFKVAPLVSVPSKGSTPPNLETLLTDPELTAEKLLAEYLRIELMAAYRTKKKYLLESLVRPSLIRSLIRVIVTGWGTPQQQFCASELLSGDVNEILDTICGDVNNPSVNPPMWPLLFEFFTLHQPPLNNIAHCTNFVRVCAALINHRSLDFFTWSKKNPVGIVQKILRHFSSDPIPNLLLGIIDAEERVASYLNPPSLGPTAAPPPAFSPTASPLLPPADGRLTSLIIPLLAPKLWTMTENECGLLQDWVAQVAVKFPRSRILVHLQDHPFVFPLLQLALRQPDTPLSMKPLSPPTSPKPPGHLENSAGLIPVAPPLSFLQLLLSVCAVGSNPGAYNAPLVPAIVCGLLNIPLTPTNNNNNNNNNSSNSGSSGTLSNHNSVNNYNSINLYVNGDLNNNNNNNSNININNNKKEEDNNNSNSNIEEDNNNNKRPLQKLCELLYTPPGKPLPSTIATSCGEISPLGLFRLKCVELVFALLKLEYHALDTAIIESRLLSRCIDLFFQYKWNNVLHALIMDMCVYVLQHKPSFFCLYLLRDCKLVDKILQAQQNEDQEKELRKGNQTPQRGYMGHLYKISNEIVNAARIHSAIFYLLDDIPNKVWKKFVEGKLKAMNVAYQRAADAPPRPVSGLNGFGGFDG